MHVRSIMTALAATTLTLTVGTTLVSSPAHAAGGSRTLSGPATGDADVYLTYVGCADLLGNAAAPASRINLGPYAAPLGRRSLGLVPTAAGSAAGPYASFDSLAGLDSSVAVAATGGSSGVSWVMAVSRQSPAGTAWRGRAAVSAPAGSWTTVSSSALTYDWALVDLASGAVVDRAGSATPAQFAADARRRPRLRGHRLRLRRQGLQPRRRPGLRLDLRLRGRRAVHRAWRQAGSR